MTQKQKTTWAFAGAAWLLFAAVVLANEYPKAAFAGHPVPAKARPAATMREALAKYPQPVRGRMVDVYKADLSPAQERAIRTNLRKNKEALRP